MSEMKNCSFSSVHSEFLRECNKASEDAALYGRGAYMVKDGIAKHIPIQDLVIIEFPPAETETYSVK